MKISAKSTIAKASICISGFLLFAAIIFPVPATLLGYHFKEIEVFWIWLWITTFISGFIMIMLLAVVGNLSFKETAEKIPMPFNSYMLFFDYLHKKIIAAGYTKVCSPKQLPSLELTLYIKTRKLWELDCIAIIRTPQIDSNLLNQANVAITEALKSNLDKTSISDTINIISLFCVDRVSSALKKLVDSPVQQGLKNGRLPIGISFGSSTIYIPKHGDGFAIGRYYRLKRFFLDIIK